MIDEKIPPMAIILVFIGLVLAVIPFWVYIICRYVEMILCRQTK
jgi:hypothetical protein